MSHQPLYATLGDSHGEVSTHSRRGRQTEIDGWVNTDIGEIMRFRVHHNNEYTKGHSRALKSRKPICVIGSIVFPKDVCILKVQHNVVEFRLLEGGIPAAVMERLTEGGV